MQQRISVFQSVTITGVIMLLVALAGSSAVLGQAAPVSGLERLDVFARQSASRTVVVDCDKGQSIAGALLKSGDLLQIEISGTCVGDLVINRNRVILVGTDPEATIEGGISVEGANEIIIRDLTIRNAPASGIAVLGNSGILIERVSIIDPALRGILGVASGILLRDLTVLNAGSVGILVRACRIEFRGDNAILNSGNFGVTITDGSAAFSIQPGNTTVSGSLIGWITQLSSETSYINGGLTANDNSLAGILTATSAAFVHGRAVMEVNNNGGPGIWVDELSAFSPLLAAGATFEISGNAGEGVLLERSSTLSLVGDTTIHDNGGTGLSVDNSTLVLNGVAFDNNGGVGDVSLTFGSRATFDSNTLGTLACDGTVLVRGDESCPPPGPVTTGPPTLESSRAATLQRVREIIANER